MSDFTLAFVKLRFRLAPEEGMQKDTFCVLRFACNDVSITFLSRCWSCCVCLSTFTSKGMVDMLCNPSRNALWSTKEKEKNTKKREKKNTEKKEKTHKKTRKNKRKEREKKKDKKKEKRKKKDNKTGCFGYKIRNISFSYFCLCIVLICDAFP